MRTYGGREHWTAFPTRRTLVLNSHSNTEISSHASFFQSLLINLHTIETSSLSHSYGLKARLYWPLYFLGSMIGPELGLPFFDHESLWHRHGDPIRKQSSMGLLSETSKVLSLKPLAPHNHTWNIVIPERMPEPFSNCLVHGSSCCKDKCYASHATLPCQYHKQIFSISPLHTSNHLHHHAYSNTFPYAILLSAFAIVSYRGYSMIS